MITNIMELKQCFVLFKTLTGVPAEENICAKYSSDSWWELYPTLALFQFSPEASKTHIL